MCIVFFYYTVKSEFKLKMNFDCLYNYRYTKVFQLLVRLRIYSRRWKLPWISNETHSCTTSKFNYSCFHFIAQADWPGRLRRSDTMQCCFFSRLHALTHTHIYLLIPALGSRIVVGGWNPNGMASSTESHIIGLCFK